ncbi:MAG TPA: peptidoglycan-associated lipoprotein Pal [Povalibacter sp.]|uniref:peptidoglycan-associated lipoprotein Pal n=1 Tax=Povalibacter sp. TaxID=1962978 RepID=UPI002CECA2BF|nr:peptidoglycan-associated lipoprotein Pal [Povalibacter sp.]HMN46241.1 peptidoglycan-associated lipoprotein Pal [Povalibacter sp.]
MRAVQWVLILMSAAVLSGCPKKPETLPDSGPATSDGATTSGTSGTDVSGSALGAEEQAIQAAQRAGTIIYFDYDKADIKSEYVPIVTAHAQFLNGNPGRKLRLEGHSDERGSREYNIGLGERRAQSVRRALLLQGVNEAQLTTVSYGEERPAVQGSDESAYSKNRRVELAPTR